jgi:hypothetical protein
MTQHPTGTSKKDEGRSSPKANTERRTQITQHPTGTSESDWWERLTANWRRFVDSGCVQALCALCDFFFNGHFIMATGKWVALVGARTAVTVLFFASVWVAGESTVHPFMVKLVGLIHFVTTDTLDNLALTAFTWLPEIIVLEAILKTVFFAIDVIKNEKRVWSSIWGLIYLPLTGVFTYIAVSTFMTYITTHAADQSNVGMLLFRALMAWMYSIIEMAYPAIYRKMYQEEAPAHAPGAVPVRTTPSVDIEAIVNKALTEQAEHHEETLRTLAEHSRQALDGLKQNNGLLQVEMQRLLAQVDLLKQGAETLPHGDAIVSEEAITERVLKHLDARFETLQSRNTRVSQGPETPESGTQRSRKQAHPNASSASEQENAPSYEAIIQTHLERDRSINHRKLSALTGISESTCYRIRRAWIRAHPVVSADPNEQIADDEDGAAM